MLTPTAADLQAHAAHERRMARRLREFLARRDAGAWLTEAEQRRLLAWYPVGEEDGECPARTG